MKIQERYTTARNASDLSVDERTTYAPSDVLGATGMTAQASPEAILLWEVTFKGKTSAKLALIELLQKRLAVEMLKNRWKGDPRKITTEVIAWLLHGTCQPCGGRAYELINGAPTLSDRICRHCNGTGKVKLPRGDAYSWLHDHIQLLIAQAAGKVMKKLATDMEL